MTGGRKTKIISVRALGDTVSTRVIFVTGNTSEIFPEYHVENISVILYCKYLRVMTVLISE